VELLDSSPKTLFADTSPQSIYGSPKRDTPIYPTIGYAAIAVQRTLVQVQRLFSMFPPGWPGVGLLFLRSSVAIALLVEGSCHRQHSPIWMQGAAILLSITLFAGYMTPIAAAIGLLVHALIWSRLGTGNAAAVIIVSLDVIALALLGPGAYSIDCFRFGRRVVVVPPP
jgi:putative oxidoreductase